LAGGPESRLYVLAHLQVFHLYGFANSVVSKGWKINVEAGVDYLAESLVSFISDNE
jgi:hypothetical protein